MRSFPVVALLSILLVACSGDKDATNPDSVTPVRVSEGALVYPDTRRGEVVDTYFGTRIADPYRWLEDDLSDETAAWVGEQNAVTQGYLDTIPYREKIAGVVKELLDYPREYAPFQAGEYSYFYANDGLQNQNVLYREKTGSDPEVFLDPNTFSGDGTVSMSSVRFSRDGSLVAYQLSEGGSDWRTIVVIDAETKAPLGEPLVDVKFSAIEWRGNEGFYYSSYDKPDGSELSAKTDQHKLYFHKVGTSQTEDELVFGGTPEQKHRYVWGSVTEDDRFLSIEAANTTSGNRLYLLDLTDTAAELATVQSDEDADASVLLSVDDQLLIKTNRDAPNGRIVSASATSPDPGNWRDVIPQTENVLQVSVGGGYLFADYVVDALTEVRQYTYGGELVRMIELPDLGTAYGFEGKEDQEVLFFTFTNYRMPPSIFSLVPQTGEVSLYRASQSAFASENYTTEQVFFSSKDGTRVPMIITYPNGAPRDGSQPTLLYGYGGFNVSERPEFRSTVAAWLELGGTYAVPNIRGGGEYGKAWHLAGTQQQKQNVFDDFIAAAEYLIDEGYTQKQKLALRGGSNGGLLVGAVLTQRPDLFQVALPAVGVLDMLRYHTFTAGAGWSYDYGRSDDSEAMFDYLLGYSPLHNTVAGTAYPATLITTADHDDRVVPAHSFKFAAQLQRDHGGELPVLIRIESDAGHGAGTPISKIVEQYADIYGFTLFNMGIEGL